jgi:hypothetical protein
MAIVFVLGEAMCGVFFVCLFFKDGSSKVYSQKWCGCSDFVFSSPYRHQGLRERERKRGREREGGGGGGGRRKKEGEERDSIV